MKRVFPGSFSLSRTFALPQSHSSVLIRSSSAAETDPPRFSEWHVTEMAGTPMNVAPDGVRRRMEALGQHTRELGREHVPQAVQVRLT